ncbi:MAG: HAMP domain-containing histidine kinase [Nocardioidaceae bacterium]|nr:HAMP domain-containing histidine kinase [Nocardioidaceae bacterium]
MSIANRIALLAACAVGLSVSMATLAAYVTLRAQLHERLDDSLLKRATAATTTNLVEDATLSDLPAEVLGAADLRIYVVYADGTIYPRKTASWVAPASTAELEVAAGIRPRSLRTISRDGYDDRAAAVPAGSGKALLFVQSSEPIERTLDQMGVVLLFVGLGGIVAAGLIGAAVARSSLMPVRRMSAAAEHIARTHELTPIDVTGDDELASLATSFNDMLASLAASRDRQRRLIADAGHELRTPLTSLRTNLELLALADRRGGLTSQQRDEIFTDATAQVEELSTLVGDLVELARDEPLNRAPEPLDLADVVDRAVQRVKRRAPSLTFDVETAPWWILGESQILERAVTNLLDNAAKWSPPGGTIGVTLSNGVLSVSDEGAGISDADLPMIFERFYRAADARTMPGSGLGLSIVRQAVERHGGSVSVARREPHGAVFTLTLPGHPDHRRAAEPVPTESVAPRSTVPADNPPARV